MSKIVEFDVGGGRIAFVDLSDWDRVRQYSWRWSWNSANKKYGYVVATMPRSAPVRGTITLHRFLLNSPKDKHVDHVNGDRLDNRRANLRLASRSQNGFNVVKRVPSSSQFKGVIRWNGAWRAQISVSKKFKHLGIFKDEWRAALAYDLAAAAIEPEFARTNFPKVFVQELITKGVTASLQIKGGK